MNDRAKDTACCAHSHVEYVRIDLDAGLCSDSWRCRDCRCLLWPHVKPAGDLTAEMVRERWKQFDVPSFKQIARHLTLFQCKEMDEAVVKFVSALLASQQLASSEARGEPVNPFSKGYKHRHGEPVSDACGDNKHAECTQDLTKCHCTFRSGHTVMHAYMSVPVSTSAGRAEPQPIACAQVGCGLRSSHEIHDLPDGDMGSHPFVDPRQGGAASVPEPVKSAPYPFKRPVGGAAAAPAPTRDECPRCHRPQKYGFNYMRDEGECEHPWHDEFSKSEPSVQPGTETAREWLDRNVPLQFLGSDTEPVGVTHIDKAGMADLLTEFAEQRLSAMRAVLEMVTMQRDQLLAADQLRHMTDAPQPGITGTSGTGLCGSSLSSEIATGKGETK